MGFDYVKVFNAKEALDAYEKFEIEGSKPKYLSGGTEILTGYRLGYEALDVVIDIKGIEKIKGIYEDHKNTYFGAATSLSYIQDNCKFGLIKEISSKIADRTSRNTITLGGNMLSHIPFREILVPLLVFDADVYVACRGERKIRGVTINEAAARIRRGYSMEAEGMDSEDKEWSKVVVKKNLKRDFKNGFQIGKGEILLGVEVDNYFRQCDFRNYKKYRVGESGYPIVTIGAIKAEEGIRVAFSGVMKTPFRSIEIERILNNFKYSKNEKLDMCMKILEPMIWDNQLASKEYRGFLVRDILDNILVELGGIR